MYNDVAGAAPLRICPSSYSWATRPRLYWPSYRIQSSKGVSSEKKPRWTVLKLHGKRCGVSHWLPRGWRLSKNFSGFPTFTRAIPRKKPAFMAAGLETLTEREKERYARWQYQYPPYQMKDKYMLVNAKKQLCPAPSSVRELVMGYRRHYTFPCWSAADRRESESKHEVARCSLLGNSFHAPTVAWLLSHVLCQWKMLPRPLAVEEAGDVTKPIVWGSEQRSKALEEAAEEEVAEAVVRHLVTRQSLRGGAATTISSISLYKGAAPESIDPELWTWRTCISTAWRFEGEHINVLEVRAVGLALAWRLRNVKNIGSKFVHLVDSLVTLMCLMKGRTSSLRLNGAVCHCNALMVAGFIQPIFAYVRTALNPADRPSRFASKKEKQATRRAPEKARRAQ